MLTSFRLLIPCVILLLSARSDAADWPRFRGADGTATSDDRGLPTTWSDEENLAWKADLPGHGASSPIVVGERVFVTCYSGYGFDAEAPGDLSNLQRHLLCLDRATGKTLWS